MRTSWINLIFNSLSRNSYVQESNIFSVIHGTIQKYNKTYQDCYLEYFVSKNSINVDENLVIDVFWPQDSRSAMKHTPVYDMIDFLLYVCSSFGIWFGISVWSIGKSASLLCSKYCKIDARKMHSCQCRRSNKCMQIKLMALMEYVSIRFDMLDNLS